jgi:hypothetical protein
MRISVENLRAASKLDRWSDAPEGWRKLGSGSSRVAFLGPDNIVYKVCGFEDTIQSRSESAVVWQWRKRTDLPEWCIIPRAYFHEETRVEAMEYFEGSQPRCERWHCECGQEECWRLRLGELSRMGWHDMQCVNALLTPEGKIVLIDMGCNAVS